MLQNQIFSPNDLDNGEYINILKSDIDKVVARPKLFPYNDAARWCFAHLQKYTGLIANASGLSISSLKTKYVKVRYKTLEPTVALNKSFLDKFGIDYNDFKTLMEDWFVDEEWTTKKGERNVPT